MEYNPEEFKEKKVPKAGDRINAKVTEVKSGKLGDFVEKDALANWKNADPESPAIEIIATTEEGHERKRTIPVPADGEVHPQSNLAKWKKSYGAYPSEGQEIFLIADGDGWYQFLI